MRLPLRKKFKPVNRTRPGAVHVSPTLVAWPTGNGTGLWAVGPANALSSQWLAQGIEGVRERLWGART